MRLLSRVVFIAFLLPCATVNAQRSFDVDILAETFGFDDSTKRSVEYNDLNQGCRARDCIPSIDDPKYVPAEEASHIADEARVITLSYKGEYRAYPARILDRHEIGVVMVHLTDRSQCFVFEGVSGLASEETSLADRLSR